jgi:hypothetical protein
MKWPRNALYHIQKQQLELQTFYAPLTDPSTNALETAPNNRRRIVRSPVTGIKVRNGIDAATMMKYKKAQL